MLIAVVLLIGGGALVVWLPYHREQVVIAEFENLDITAYSVIVRPFWISDAIDDEYLWVFERVTTIDLDDTPASDAELEHLRGLTNLEFLYLERTHVSDAGLEHLRGLANLGYLLLEDTYVTQAGIDKLQKALPNCQIDWTPPAE